MSRTNILEHLSLNQSMRTNRVYQNFLLSDGKIGNTNNVISSVFVNKRSYIIFSVGVGSET
jgi:hypothetical protein